MYICVESVDYFILVNNGTDGPIIYGRDLR